MRAQNSNTESQQLCDAAIPPVGTWFPEAAETRQRYGGLHIAAVSAKIAASNADENCEFFAQRAR
jgi:hypothetical protein